MSSFFTKSINQRVNGTKFRTVATRNDLRLQHKPPERRLKLKTFVIETEDE